MADCLFCKIVEKKIPAKIHYEDPDILIFHDVNPQAPVHVLVIPKKHIPQVGKLSAEDEALMGKLLLRLKDVAEKSGWNDYRLVVNNGAQAQQTVFHLHIHLLSGRAMTWPPG